MKRSLKEFMRVGPQDANIDGGYGTMKNSLKPRPSADGFPYHLDNEEPIEDDNIFANPKEKKKFINKVHLDYPSVEKDNLNFRSDRKSFIDGETRGISDSIIKDYVKIIVEDFFTARPNSASGNFINQFGDRLNPAGSKRGWSLSVPFEDDKEEEAEYSIVDLIKKDQKKQGLE